VAGLSPLIPKPYFPSPRKGTHDSTTRRAKSR